MGELLIIPKYLHVTYPVNRGYFVITKGFATQEGVQQKEYNA